MTRRTVCVLFACCVLAAVGRAADPPAVPTADLDKLVVEVLKDLHNRGADLYNAADAPGALRTYEATLRAVSPFLAHRPKIQTAIADGLVDALKQDGTKAQAFRLHEVIEQVRADLKGAIRADAEAKSAAALPDPPRPIPNTPDPPRPIPDTPDPPRPIPNLPDPPRPAPPPPAPTVGSLRGVVTLDGKPLREAVVTLVSLTLPQPRVFSTAADDEGRFTFAAELPPAKYAAILTAPAVPAKYQSTMTSGLAVAVAAGEQTADLKLQSK